MEKVTVAVVGAGPTGLSMLKNLREDGFAVTVFERRREVGGLWVYTDDTTVTSAFPSTVANGSKYSASYSDFPIPAQYPPFLTANMFKDYLHSYAQHFDLYKDIVLDTIVEKVTRNSENSKWQIQLQVSGNSKVEVFDKVIFANGYQTKPKMPTFDAQELFKGTLIHAQQMKKPEELKGKKVVIVGLGSTAADIVTELLPHSANMYISHRRGAVIGSRWRNGTPVDLNITWQRIKMAHIMQHHLPTLSRKLADVTVAYLMRKQWGTLDSAWRLQPSPSVSFALPLVSETLIPLLREGKVTSVHGIRKFTGPHSIEFLDGTVLEDVGAVICATGYTADFNLASFVQNSSPPNGKGREILRLYQNLFPTQCADSIACLNYSAFGKANGIGFGDVLAMAISNIWRGISPLPPKAKMEAWIDTNHKWVAEQWKVDQYLDPSKVDQGSWQKFLHDAAGTGMENVGWGWKGWKFWWHDRELSNLICNGVATSHAFRVFETGKRRTWEGARQAIIDVNESVKVFPLKE